MTTTEPKSKLVGVVDIESTGLPKDIDNGACITPENCTEITQVTLTIFKICEDTGSQIIDTLNFWILPEGEINTKDLPYKPAFDKAFLEGKTRHNVTNEKLNGPAPTFQEIGPKIAQSLEPLDFICGSNIGGFDIPMLIANFDKYGIRHNVSMSQAFDIKDPAKLLWPEEESKNKDPRWPHLGDIYEKLFPGNKIKNAHDARADVDATYESLIAMMEREETRNAIMKTLFFRD